MNDGSVVSQLSRIPKAIELRHLRYFLAAAERGSFRKAAAALSIQESSISRQIRNLENHVGVSLFQRHGAGVTLTIAGERFLPNARRVLKAIAEGTRDIEVIGRGETGTVRIGIFSSLASGFLSDLLRVFTRKHDGVRMDFIDGDPGDHVSAIRQLKLDVAFLTGTSKWSECDTADLWFERVFVVLPDNHNLLSQEEVSWSDLAESKFIVSDVAPGQEIYDFLVQRLADLGHHPEIRPQFVGRDNLLPLVALGHGLTLTSEATTAASFPGVAYRPVSGENLPFRAVWSPRNDNPALRRLLSLARAMSRCELLSR